MSTAPGPLLVGVAGMAGGGGALTTVSTMWALVTVGDGDKGGAPGGRGEPGTVFGAEPATGVCWGVLTYLVVPGTVTVIDETATCG